MVIGHTIPKDVFGKIFVTDDVLSKITYDIRPNSHELYEKFNAYIKQEGFFLLDPDDMFFRALIQKSDIILADQNLIKLLSRYFKVLYLLFFTAHLRDTILLNISWLTSIEQKFLETIGLSLDDYKPLNVRIGVLWEPYMQAITWNCLRSSFE